MRIQNQSSFGGSLKAVSNGRDFKETRNQSTHLFTLKPNLLNGIYPVFKKSNADRSYSGTEKFGCAVCSNRQLEVIYDLLES